MLKLLPDAAVPSHHQKKGAFVLPICGSWVERIPHNLPISPSSRQFIHRQLTEKVTVAMLSFSTGGAAHERIKVVQATQLRSVNLICASMENCSSTRHSSRLSAMPNRRTLLRAMPTSLCSPISKPPISATKIATYWWGAGHRPSASGPRQTR